MKWFETASLYQIYPFGLLGAEHENTGTEIQHRLPRLEQWIPHWKKLGVTTLLFNPLFESDAHGYDTRDMRVVDKRLGSNEDLEHLCKKLHEAGFHVLFDGVFNHVGRNFFAFQDVLKNREGSQYRDWFHINFGGNNQLNDGLWYEPWEGYLNLVKLNVMHPDVQRYIFDSIREWKQRYGIDGLRLDVAYTINPDFIRALHHFCLGLDPDFFLLGEMIHGDYKRLLQPDLCHSVTNYECAKGLVSAFNCHNLFEIAHSLQRQFNNEPWALYHGINTLNAFVDNHDINRAASAVQQPEHLPLVYTIMFTMPGIATIYYGSEWGVKGMRTSHSDYEIRQAFDKPEWNSLTDHLARLTRIRAEHEALACGAYRTVLLTNEQFIFERRCDQERVLIAVNCSPNEFVAHFDADCGLAEELLTGEKQDFGGGTRLPGYSARIWKMER